MFAGQKRIFQAYNRVEYRMPGDVLRAGSAAKEHGQRAKQKTWHPRHEPMIQRKPGDGTQRHAGPHWLQSRLVHSSAVARGNRST